MSLRSKEKGAGPILLLCWMAYTSAYLGRYSYNSNITAVLDAFGVSHADAGLVTTCFFFAYGIGQVVHGALCRYYPKRWIVPLALTVSAALNAAIFFGVPFAAYKYLWLVNGAMQSILWPTLISVLSQSLPAERLKTSVVVMSTTVPIGTFLAYGFSALMAVSGSFCCSFLFGSAVMAGTAAVWLCAYRGPSGEKRAAARGGSSPANRRLQPALFVTVGILCLFAAVNNLVKDGLTTWVPSILKEKYSLPEGMSIVLTLVLPILGMFGAACNAALERRIPSLISLSGLWYLLTVVCIGAVVLFVQSDLWWMVLLLFGAVSLSMHAVNNVITSMAPLYLREKADSGFLAGLLNGFCYVGSTFSSYGLGAVADALGWNGVFLLLLAVSCIPALVAGGYALRRKTGAPPEP